MYKLNALPLWPQLCREQPDEGTPTPSPTPTPTSDPTPAPSGDDTPTGGDLLGGDDTTSGEPAPTEGAPGDLLSDPNSTPEFNHEAIDTDSVKALFDENTDWDDETLSGFVDMLNEATSLADIAQKGIEMFDQINQDAATSMTEQWNQTVAEWQTEARNHSELGGDNLDRTLATVKDFINKHAPDPQATLELFRQTGVSNSIHLISLLHAAAKAVPGQAIPADGDPAPTGLSIAEKLFPASS